MARTARLLGVAPDTAAGGQTVATSVRRRVLWLATIGPALMLADAAAVLLAGLVTAMPAATVVLTTALAVVLSWAADLHRPRLVLSIVEDLPGLLVVAASATLVVLGRPSQARFGVLTFAGLVLAHTLVYTVAHLLRRHGRLGRRVLVVGTGTQARRLAAALLVRPELGLRPIGFVATGTATAGQARGLPLTLLGPVAWLPRIMTETVVSAVVLALDRPAGENEAAALEGLLATPTDVYAVPGWFPDERARARHPRELVDGIPVVHLHQRGTSRPVRAVKRLMEVVVALLTLVTLLPLFTILAVLVKVETGGVLVRDTRVDQHGWRMSAPSFRTRRARSVARPGTTFSLAYSGRIGPVGLLLLRTRLVALPTLVWAVLRQVRHPGGASIAALTAASRTDQPQVDTSQLAR